MQLCTARLRLLALLGASSIDKVPLALGYVSAFFSYCVDIASPSCCARSLLPVRGMQRVTHPGQTWLGVAFTRPQAEA